MDWADSMDSAKATAPRITTDAESQEACGTQVQPTGAAKRLQPASPSLLSREIFQTPRKNREESCPQLPSRKQGSEGFFLATVVIPES